MCRASEPCLQLAVLAALEPSFKPSFMQGQAQYSTSGSKASQGSAGDVVPCGLVAAPYVQSYVGEISSMAVLITTKLPATWLASAYVILLQQHG